MNTNSTKNIIIVSASGNIGKPLTNALNKKGLNPINLSKSGRSESIKFDVENEEISDAVEIKDGNSSNVGSTFRSKLDKQKPQLSEN